MVEELRSQLPQVEELCRKYGVVHLDVFGSAARGDFDPARSDFDFLVKFAQRGDLGPSRQYLGLLHGLEDLFGRDIHLAEDFPGQKASFLERIEPDRKQLYAA
ncbi:MAG: nucleotidyltransferase family protein [Fimbriimonadales bacterium]